MTSRDENFPPARTWTEPIPIVAPARPLRATVPPAAPVGPLPPVPPVPPPSVSSEPCGSDGPSAESPVVSAASGLPPSPPKPPMVPAAAVPTAGRASRLQVGLLCAAMFFAGAAAAQFVPSVTTAWHRVDAASRVRPPSQQPSAVTAPMSKSSSTTQTSPTGTPSVKPSVPVVRPGQSMPLRFEASAQVGQVVISVAPPRVSSRRELAGSATADGPSVVAVADVVVQNVSRKALTIPEVLDVTMVDGSGAKHAVADCPAWPGGWSMKESLAAGEVRSASVCSLMSAGQTSDASVIVAVPEKDSGAAIFGQ